MQREAFISTILESMKRAFLSPINTELVTWRLMQRGQADGDPFDKNIIFNQMPKHMQEYTAKHNIDKYASETGNWMEVIEFINQEFIDHLYNKLIGGAWLSEEAQASGMPQPDMNPFHAKAFGKPIDELQPEEYGNLDLFNYDTAEQFRWNSSFRRLNKIRGWEAQLCKRHYDYHETDGFRDTRDLEVPQRGFDMTAIQNVHTTYTKPKLPSARERNPGYGDSRYNDPTPYESGPDYLYRPYTGWQAPVSKD